MIKRFFVLRRPFSRFLKRWVVLVLLVSQCSCGSIIGNSVYTHEQFDIAAYKKVAVIPLQNFTSEPRAGARVTSAFTTELLSTHLFDIVDSSQVGEFLRSARLESESLGIQELRKLKASLGVKAVFMGSVDEYVMQSFAGDTFPLVTISSRLVDAETGIVLWGATVSGSGDPKVPILSLGRVKTLPEMAQVICKHIVGTIR